MKKVFIVANWKSNKITKEARKWIEDLSNSNFNFMDFKEIIICPSFSLLSSVKLGIQEIIGQKLKIKVGAQDISQFDEGAYTGGVNGRQIKELADYVIVGHSERRNNFGEDGKIVNEKISKALKYNLIPILCVSDMKQIHDSRLVIHNSNFIVAYEPTFAIGTGTPDTPENADKMAKNIKEILGEIPVLYGGSVSKFNIKSFTQMSYIDGALVGRASLDVKEFATIIQNA
ncbi:MAG: triosephosphate isomerase [Candidatus Levybacteria bacterium]|nr:triosephosphate isomerase [Candidatus Levybacteria bacterium]